MTAPPTAGSSPVRRSLAGALVLFAVVCGLGLFADLFTKYLAFDRASTRLADEVVQAANGRWVAVGSDERARTVLPRFLDLHATVNEGAVFGLGQGKRLWFLAVSAGAIAFLIYLVARSRTRFEVILLGCLLAGVLGNMYDRIRFGYVRDMLLALPGFRWPGTWQLPGGQYPGIDRLVFPYIFNIADCLLVCGVAVLVIRSLFEGNAGRRGAESAEEDAEKTKTKN